MRRLLSITTAILLLAASSIAFAVDFRRAKPTLDDVFSASCRVSVEGARGSGLFVYYNDSKAYVLTNYHVVQNSATAKLDFWTNHTRQSVTGRVVKRFSDRRANLDFAIIEIDANELKKIDPPFIPLAPVDPSALTGRKIYAAGGPKGWFVQTWKGANESIESGLVLFSPHPVPGQSGSGVCTIIDGEIYAVEVLTYLLGDENSDSSKGGALPVLYLANALKGVRYDFGDALDKVKPIPVADTAAPELSILAFTTNDCPACKIGEVGLSSFEDTGGVVERVNLDDPQNAHYIEEYNLTETPTYFVVDEKKTPLVRISYAEIQKSGAVAAVRYAVASATAPKTAPTPTPTLKPIEEVENDVRLDSDHGVIISDAGEPKKTLPVYVTDPKEYAFDMRQPVYDDSGTETTFDLFSGWTNRGKDGQEGDTEPGAENMEGQEQSRLGDRIAERLATALAPKIEKSVGVAADAIAKKIGEDVGAQLSDETTPLGGLKKDVEKKLDAKAKELFSKYAWRVALDLVILMVLAQLATQGVIAGVKWLFSAGIEMRKEVARYRDYLENGNNDKRQS